MILDRKKGFLSFPMTAMEMIAEVIPTVKDGAELTSILKSCNTIFCTDNYARQITISGKRTAFYSVYLSEFEDDILDIIDFLEVEEFFFDPADVPKNFVPIIWHNGRCAVYLSLVTENQFETIKHEKWYKRLWEIVTFSKKVK